MSQGNSPSAVFIHVEDSRLYRNNLAQQANDSNQRRQGSEQSAQGFGPSGAVLDCAAWHLTLVYAIAASAKG